MSVVKQLLTKWRADGVRLNAPASEEHLVELERCLGVPLPSDVREFYGAANGMPDLEYDTHQMSFWSVNRIVAEPPRRPVSNVPGVREVAFADFLIESHYHVFRVTSEGRLTVGNDMEAVDENESLQAFLLRYLVNPGSLPVIVV
jgi:hypothetical protein